MPRREISPSVNAIRPYGGGNNKAGLINSWNWPTIPRRILGNSLLFIPTISGSGGGFGPGGFYTLPEIAQRSGGKILPADPPPEGYYYTFENYTVLNSFYILEGEGLRINSVFTVPSNVKIIILGFAEAGNTEDPNPNVKILNYGYIEINSTSVDKQFLDIENVGNGSVNWINPTA